MTEVVDGVLYISREERECQFCHKTTDVRPYGPEAKDICVGCADLPQYADTVNANFQKRFEGVKAFVVGKAPCAKSV